MNLLLLILELFEDVHVERMDVYSTAAAWDVRFRWPENAGGGRDDEGEW